MKSQAKTELTGDVPFISDAQLSEALAGTDLSPAVQQEIVDVNADARLEALRVALSVAAVLAAVALFFTGKIPTTQPGRRKRVTSTMVANMLLSGSSAGNTVMNAWSRAWIDMASGSVLPLAGLTVGRKMSGG